jgi:hypothetical protein
MDLQQGNRQLVGKDCHLALGVTADNVADDRQDAGLQLGQGFTAGGLVLPGIGLPAVDFLGPPGPDVAN